ncbi:MAG: zinc ribbon domain-containing protein [Clostridiales bacterium]|nr:zinc ribbon domain-containing protein [Clostridiales bacterium]
MAFLNKLNDIAKNIGDKAGDAIETTKLNSKINSEKSAIDGIYKKIGEYYYQLYQADGNLPEEAAAFCAEIDAHNVAIAEAKAEIERIKAENAAAAEAAPAPAPMPKAPDEIFCTDCGKANQAGTKFCSECGGKLASPGKRTCACGAEIVPGVRFCGECGAKLEE